MFNSKMILVVLSAVGGAVLTAAVWSGGFDRSAEAQTGGRIIDPANVRDPVYQLTRMEMDVYELVCARDRMADLDLNVVAEAAPTPQAVRMELEKFGRVRTLLRYQNEFDLYRGTTIRSGETVPVVQDILVSGNDVFTPSIGYQGTGFRAEIAGEWQSDVSPTQARLDLAFEFSDQHDQSLRITENIELPQFTERLISEYSRAVKSGQPVLMACNQLELTATGDQATTTIVRLVATRLGD